MITSSGDGSLRVCNLHTGTHIASWRGRGRAVSAMALSLDGNKVVSGSEDGAVRL
jgi:WD40 repeat protein